jgi:tetratricopeptide (TPR) repeat protein
MRRTGRAVLIATLAVGLFGAGGLGLIRVGSSPDQATAPPTQADRLAASPLLPAASLGQAITELQQRLRAVPSDWRSFASLGLAYVQQARVTADPTYYPKAEGVLTRSLDLNRDENFVGLTGLGALALARHDFAGAFKWGKEARAVNPYNGNVYGVIGDSLVELGRYAKAFRTIQRMVDLKPDLGSYARVSYARELQGDVRGAIQAMRLALGAAGTPEDASWLSYQLGELYWNSGRPDRAAVYYHRALQFDATFLPPRAGLAKAAWARGDVARAIAGYRWVVARYPLPEYVIALGDLYTLAGRPHAAASQHDLLRAEERLYRSNGVNVDLELALFDADHGRPKAGLTAARAEWRRRHSVQVADALAWALYRNGRSEAAVPYVRRALSLGMRNALFFFHAGMIDLALGRADDGRANLQRALAINPHFSIQHASTAMQTLRRLEGAP